MKKILFIAAHRPDRDPSQRFRFEHYLPYLKEAEYEYVFSFLLSERQDKLFYKKNSFARKIFIVFSCFFKRFRDVFRAKSFDIIFIHREAFFIGPPFFERLLKWSGVPIIFDFDDAIWVNDVSEANRKIRWLKNSAKIPKIIKMSDLVFAGNSYLQDYALKRNSNTVIIPTLINVNYHKSSCSQAQDKAEIVIGWTGSLTTVKHFKTLIGVLKIIKIKYKNVLIRLIGDENYVNEDLDLKGLPWNLNSEISDLSSFDIGIMPLPDDEWAKGKCGFKGLQYMALGIPTIMSPVGVNSEIIQDGENGFLCSTDEEWINRLSQLIESKELREKIGKVGRKTVVEKYSVDAYKDIYLKYFDELASKK